MRISEMPSTVDGKRLEAAAREAQGVALICEAAELRSAADEQTDQEEYKLLPGPGVEDRLYEYVGDAVSEQDEVEHNPALCVCGKGYEGHDAYHDVAGAASRLTDLTITEDGGVIVGPVGWNKLIDALYRVGGE